MIIPESIGKIVEVKDDNAGFLTYGDAEPILTITYVDESTQNISNLDNYTLDQDKSNIKTAVFLDGATEIPNEFFNGCSSLTSVTIINSITSIGLLAFNNCSSLTSITIHNSVTSIGDYAFSNCSSLASIIVDSDNTIYNDGNGSNCIIKTSDNTLLFGCKNTVIPDTVTSIGSCAFLGCTELTNIIIPDSVTSISGAAFFGCSSLASIELSDSLISIGDSALYGCSSLTSITIPDSVTSIGAAAFTGCGFTEFTIPANITTFDSGSNCTNLKKVYISKGCKLVITQGFMTTFLNNVTDLYIDETSEPYTVSNYTWIPIQSHNGTLHVAPGGSKSTFSTWTNSNGNLNVPTNWKLVADYIPYTAVKQSDNTYKFYDSSNNELSSELKDDITKVYYDSTTNKYYNNSVIKTYYVNINDSSIKTSYTYTEIGDEIENPTVIITSESNSLVMELCYAQGWAAQEDQMIKEEAELVTSIGSAFMHNGSGSSSSGSGIFTKDFTFNEFQYFTNVTSLGYNAFSSCTYLTEITLPSSLTSIGSISFSGCTSLVKITSEAETAPTISSGTFKNVKVSGMLVVPTGHTTDYDSWMSTDQYYLGYYSWEIKQVIDFELD